MFRTAQGCRGFLSRALGVLLMHDKYYLSRQVSPVVLYVRGPQPQPYPGHEGALHLLGDRGHEAAQEGGQLHAGTLLALLDTA